MLGVVFRVSVSLAAESAPLELVWGAPRQCPQHSDVIAQIQKLTGGVQQREPIYPLNARGVIETSRDQFQLTLLIQDGSTTGTRSLASASCQTLGDAAAVVLSLLIRQRRLLGRGLSDEELSRSATLEVPAGTSVSPKSEGTSASPNSPPPPSVTSATTDRQDAKSTAPIKPQTGTEVAAPGSKTPPALTRDGQTQEKIPDNATSKAGAGQSLRFLLAAPTMQFEYGSLPKASGGAGLALGVVFDAWQFFATGALFVPQTSHVSGTREFETEFLGGTIAGWVCRAWDVGTFKFAPCALVATNIVEVSASGKRIDSRSTTGTWLSIGGGAKASLNLSRVVALAIRATGRFALNRPEFVVDDYGSGEFGTASFRYEQRRLHRVPAGSLELTFGCEWYF